MMGPYMMGGFGGTSILWMLFNLIFFILIIAGIVLFIIWIVRRTASSSSSLETKKGSALEILKERYAKGEISKNEFDEMKKDLT
ncbi:MAG: SHOCT domain-containing protein [Actinobacteria bacterium]|nr:SHOCT domain-containing protein [Actinomycetota bacterium]